MYHMLPCYQSTTGKFVGNPSTNSSEEEYFHNAADKAIIHELDN